MKYLGLPTLFLLIIIASANTSQAQTTPADKQAAAHSKQDAKATKQKPSASKATAQTKATTSQTLTKPTGSKKSTKAADAAYAAAYKEGLPEQNKGTAPR